MTLQDIRDELPFGATEEEQENDLQYGPLVLKAATKDGKANTLLADQFFSPSLFLAEFIEREVIDLGGLSVIELGSGAALPSLLLSTLPHPQTPALITVTDHPDSTIMSNLVRNVERNAAVRETSCQVYCKGYIWGEDPTDLIQLLDKNPTNIGPQSHPQGYDAMILSDLLYFDASHEQLVSSITRLLRRSRASQAFVAAGTYTPDAVCSQFLRFAAQAGLESEERTPSNDERERIWLGKLRVVGLTRDELALRKAQVRLWILRWSEDKVEHR